MPVFDFKNSPVQSKTPECTYKVFYSSNSQPSASQPILVLDNHAAYSCFSNAAFAGDSENKCHNIIPPVYLICRINL